MAEAVMSVVTLKYGSHRSWWHQAQRQVGECFHRLYKKIQKKKNLSHLSLFVLEHLIDARVEGRTGKHGGDGIRQVQHSFKNGIHRLREHKPEKSSDCFQISISVKDEQRLRPTLDHSLALCLVLTALLSSAYSAPMNEPIDVPPTMSIGIPASSIALITPT